MKQPVLNYILGFLAMFFIDIQEALFAIGFLIMADTFTGIWAAWKSGYKIEKSWLLAFNHIHSRKMGRVVVKLILYPLAIIVSKVAEVYLTPAIPWIDVTSGIIAVVEVKSIFENIGKILGFNLWEMIKKKMWSNKEEDNAGK